MHSFIANSLSRSLSIVTVAAAAACGAGPSPVEQEFRARGLDFPVHICSLPSEAPRLVNPGEFGERAAPELRDLLASGWQSFLNLPHRRIAEEQCSTAEAFEFSDPVLFQDNAHIDLGVTLTCYGLGEAPSRATWVDGEAYWKVANIALFRDEGDKWTMDGWVY